MSALAEQIEEVIGKVQLAGVYLEDGAFRSAARCLREAAGLLTALAAERDAAIRELGR